MKKTILIAAVALMSTAASARNAVFTGNPGNERFMGNPDTMDHILLDLPDPAIGNKAASMTEPRDFYGTSKQEMSTGSTDRTWMSHTRDVNPDVYGNIILDVHPELVPAWSDYR